MDRDKYTEDSYGNYISYEEKSRFELPLNFWLYVGIALVGLLALGPEILLVTAYFVALILQSR